MDNKPYIEAMFEHMRAQLNRLQSQMETYQQIHEARINDLKDGQDEIRTSLKELSKAQFCRIEACEKKFLPRWLLTITIAALVFIGSIGLSNRIWIEKHKTEYKIEQQIRQMGP